MALILWIVFFHFIADFALQTRKMAKEKSGSFYYLFLHMLIQFLIYIALLLFFVGLRKALIFSALNAAIHGFIDWNIWKLYKKMVTRKMKKFSSTSPVQWPYWEDYWFYFTIGADQFIHTSTLIILFYKVLQ